MHTHKTKFDRQSWWRGADRHSTWRCKFDGQPTKALPSLPPVHNMGLGCWLGNKIHILNGSKHTHGTKFNRQRWWKGANRHQTWWSAFYGQLTTALPTAYDMCTDLLIRREISKSWTDRWTLTEQSRGDGEKLIDSNLGDMHSTDSRKQPSLVCLQLTIWA